MRKTKKKYCIVFFLLMTTVSTTFARPENVINSYANGDPKPFWAELRSVSYGDDSAGVDWIRALRPESRSDRGGMRLVRQADRLPIATLLEPVAIRVNLPEINFKMAYIWQSAGRQDKFMEWLEKAAKQGYTPDFSGRTDIWGPYTAKYEYAIQLLLLGDAEGGRKWFESAMLSGDQRAERLLINSYVNGIASVYPGIPQTALDSWHKDPLRAARLLEARAYRMLSDVNDRVADTCTAMGDLVQIELGWGGLRARNPDKALELAQQAYKIPYCDIAGAGMISRAIGAGGGKYSPEEREKLTMDWGARAFTNGTAVP